MRLQGFEQVFYLSDVHLVDTRFFLHILVVGHLGDNLVAGISQQGMVLLLRVPI